MKKLLTLYLSICLLGLSAQQSQDVFGKNRVQYKQLEWKFISTKNFNIYYYQGGNSLAHNTARHLETIYDDLTNSLGYLPYNKINILVYNSDADLQQSNISLENNYSAGGETNLIKSKIEISFKGSQVVYFQELKLELSKLFINIIMYGGNFRDAVQSSYLIEFPEWFLSGCAYYMGKGETEEMYNATRDFLTKKRLNLDKLTGEKATLVGASVFHYIDTKYGNYSIANILSLAKGTRSEEVGIRSAVGMTYIDFFEDWAFFHEELLQIDKEKNSDLRIKKSSTQSFITQERISSDETKIAYAINRKGIYYVFSKNLTSGKKKLIYYGGIKDIAGKTDKKIPLLAWKNNQELSLIKFKKGKPYLLTKNIDKRFQREKKLFVTFDAITSFDFHPNEEDIVLSGVKRGQSDIYTYNVKENIAKRITFDLYDDLNPHYSPSGKKIIFSSNRLNDTLRLDVGGYSKINSNYNLFEFRGKKVLKKITNSPLKETYAQYIDENRILFLASNGKQSYLYKSDLTESSPIAKKINLYPYHIFSFEIIKDQIVYKIRKKDRDIIYQGNFSKNDTSGNYLLKRVLKPLTKPDSVIHIPTEALINNLLNVDPFKTGYNSDPDKYSESKVSDITGPSKNDIKISFPKETIPQFGIDYVISTIESDPIRNLGALFEVGTSDMFRNHKISGSVFTSANLRSYDMNFRYDYLKGNIDLGAEIIKDSYFRVSNESLALQRQSKTDLTGIISKPFSPVARLQLVSGISRTTFINFFAINDVAKHNLYSKNELSFVYDNTTEKSVNQLHGFRLKTSFLHLGKISGNTAGFNKFTFDARNYQPIFRDLVFATRFSYGNYGGTLPRVFIMGGTDNWLFQQYEDNEEFDPFFFTTDFDNPYLLYSDFTTNLRGFGYNKINGQNHLLLNAELRIPIIKMLYSGPISSSFFRNLQLNAFYETGSAWNGQSPFNKDNSINTRTIGGPPSPFTAIVTNYQNPFLSSYGFGFRSIMFGYYMKLDIGWGVQNFVVQKPKLQVSLGYDF